MKRYLFRHFLILSAAIIAALVLSFFLTRSPLAWFRKPLPAYGVVPAFELTERSDRPVTNNDMLGKIWVADFIYTTCPGPCLDLSRNLARLQTEIPRGIDCRFVSFTVDPAADTTAVLRSYAENHDADPNRWLFLTGDKTALYDLFEHGFHLAIAENEPDKQATDGKFIHTTKMVLIDRKGVIRGYYDGISSESRAQLVSDVAHLNRE